MRMYLSKTVYEAAQERLKFIYDEFDTVVVGFSGGKDSVVCLNLAINEAKKRGIKKVPVVFVDQEAEWSYTIEFMRQTAQRKDVEMYWFQIPIQISNSTSEESDWLQCWEDGVEWVRPKEINTIHENKLGTKNFSLIWGEILKTYFGDNSVYISGVRCDESPTRAMALTGIATYKYVTWARKWSVERRQYTFYPIYDWKVGDVWHAIEYFQWPYCKIYDLFYQKGVPTNQMRLSSLHHETVRNFNLYAELDPSNWNAITKRIPGLNTAKHLKEDFNNPPKKLPEAFHSWKQYRDYLLENLITKEANRVIFRKEFGKDDQKFGEMGCVEDMYKAHIKALMITDTHMTTVGNWRRKPDVNEYKKWKWKGIRMHPNMRNKYIEQDKHGTKKPNNEKAN